MIIVICVCSHRDPHKIVCVCTHTQCILQAIFVGCVRLSRTAPHLAALPLVLHAPTIAPPPLHKQENTTAKHPRGITTTTAVCTKTQVCQTRNFPLHLTSPHLTSQKHKKQTTTTNLGRIGYTKPNTPLTLPHTLTRVNSPLLHTHHPPPPSPASGPPPRNGSPARGNPLATDASYRLHGGIVQGLPVGQATNIEH